MQIKYLTVLNIIEKNQNLLYNLPLIKIMRNGK